MQLLPLLLDYEYTISTTSNMQHLPLLNLKAIMVDEDDRLT